MTPDYSLTVERTVRAPINTVFDAWLDPTLLKAWMRPGPGMTVPEAVTDPVVGGKFRIVMRAGDRDIPHEGAYQIIDRPTRLAFTWISQPAGENTLVTITFSPISAEETKVSLTHERFQTEAARDSHRGGWSSIVDVLAATLESA